MNEKLREALSLALQYVPAESKNPLEQEEIDKIHLLVKEGTKAIPIEPPVMLNFAEEDLEIIKELLVGNKDELKKHIFYKRNEEYCKNRLIKIEEIISKISA